MKILVVGYCKTGTKSVEKALTLLGYSVSSYIRNVSELSNDWDKFLNGHGTAEDLKRMFRGYDVASDSPSNMYWKIFLEAFPDLKLIFMMRDPDDWWRSFSRQLETETENIPLFYRMFSTNARKYFGFGMEKDRSDFFTKMQSYMSGSSYPEMNEDVEKNKYRAHNQNILQNAPKKQLLTLNLADGWKPLCQFLQVKQPDIPFPHENKNAQWARSVITGDPFFLEMKSQAWRSVTILCIIGGMVAGLFISHFLK